MFYIKPGKFAVLVHKFGNWRMTITPKILRIPFSILYKIMYIRCRDVYGIELPYTVKIGKNFTIEHQHGIVIHGNSKFGDNCIVRQCTTIGNRYLDRPLEAPKFGNNVNIGANCVIMGNITIGNNVNIGANSTILKNIPDNKTIGGLWK